MQAFPEELVLVILSFVFGISDIRFYDVIHQLFLNNNVNNNVVDVLCVCQQWHRIGLVCLYDTIIIRSRAQALALATTLDENPHLGPLIKRARIEGAYPRLDDIFKKCVNLDILNLLLWDILLMEDMHPLCRALKVVNPVAFLFLDRPRDPSEVRTQRRNDNFDLVHKSLCSAVPTWSRLNRFRCYWSGRDLHTGSPWTNYLYGHRLRLAKALSNSSSLRMVSTMAPLAWPNGLDELLNVPTISFRLEFQYLWPYPYEGEYATVKARFEKLNRWDRRVVIRFSNTEWMHVGSSEYSELMATPFVSTKLALSSAPPTGKRLHAFIRPNTAYSHIWRKIFLLCLFNSFDPDVIIGTLSRMSGYLDFMEVDSLIRKRDAIRTVSRMWEAMLNNALAPHPLLNSIQDIFELAKSCDRAPTIGQKMRFLTLNLLPAVNEGCVPWAAGILRPASPSPTMDAPLLDLLPHLSNLVCFLSTPFFSITPSTFRKLALHTGGTLETLLNVYVASSSDDDRISTADVHIFQKLQSFRYVTPPRWEVRSDHGYVFLAPDIIHTCDAFHMIALFPVLSKVSFCQVTEREEAFLRVVGTQIRELEVVLTDCTAQSNGAYDLLACCPNLEMLVLGSKELDIVEQEDLIRLEFLEVCKEHTSLKTVVINIVLSKTDLPCDLEEFNDESPFYITQGFLATFNPFKFPNMREVRFDGYSWPVSYRYMKDNPIIDIAILYAKSGIVVTDRSGMPFRRRLQHREGALAERSKRYDFLKHNLDMLYWERNGEEDDRE